MTVAHSPNHDDRLAAAGHHCRVPMSVAGWKQIIIRTWKVAGDDNADIVAAGVSFYGFLALVPVLGAIVLSYGLIADPASVIRSMHSLTSIMPADAAKLIGKQLMNVVKTSGSKKGLGLLVALGLALFGARAGAASIVTALNIAYEEEETRSFIRLNLLALVITGAGVLVAIVASVAIAALGHLEKLLPGAPGFVVVLGKLSSYGFVALAGAAGAATLYRYAPNRRAAKWVWLTPGSAFAAVAWLGLTAGFGVYVADFGNYNATYGSLGAVVVMLTWLYLSSYVLIMGAELNSELEKQATRHPTTVTAQELKADGTQSADVVASANAALASERAIATSIGPSTLASAGSCLTKDFLTSQAAQRVGGLAGFEKGGVVATLLTTGGLALLKRRRRAPAGLALLAAGALLAWCVGTQTQDL